MWTNSLCAINAEWLNEQVCQCKELDAALYKNILLLHFTLFLLADLAHGHSCHQRGLFIDACKIVIELFSRSYFKTTLFDHLLALSMDSVPNIRLRLCPMLPVLKSLIKFPTDRSLLQSLEQCVRRILINEKDKDVLVAIDKVLYIIILQNKV